MEKTKYDVFISYSRKDFVDEKGEVKEDNAISLVRNTFDQANISYWLDEEGIYSGDEYMEKLADAIAESSILLFVSSKNSNESEWTAGEVGTAHLYKKKIIPFRLDDSPYSRRIIVKIASLDYIDYYQNHEKAMSELVKAVNVYKDELERLRLEEEKRKEQQALLARKNEIKEEIQTLINDYKRLHSQQQIYVNQIYEKKESIDEKIKRCPVCGKKLNLRDHFCNRCGQLLPLLFGLDSSSNSLDDMQLSLAKTNWQSLERNTNDLHSLTETFDIQKKEWEEDKKEWETTSEELHAKREELEKRIEEKDKEIEDWLLEVETLSTSLNRCKEDLTKKEKDWQSLKKLKKEWEKEKNELISQRDQLQERCRALEEKQKDAKQKDVKTKSDGVAKSKNMSTAKAAAVRTYKKIQNIDEAFAVIENCCARKPIQDDFKFNKAKLSIDKLRPLLENVYNIRISNAAIVACKDVGELKQLIYKLSKA